MSARAAGDADRVFMRRALALARRGWGQTAPNPMVGAVVVREGRVVGEGYHARLGEAHAEVMALARAGERARGATVYVSLEPCAHHGRTPPCTEALVAAGVARVVAAIRDPHPVAAGGAERLRAAGIVVEFGCEAEAARELNAPFLNGFSAHRPWVTLKLAVSLDGALADAAGRSRWITGARARRAAHELRAGSDAVAVGIGTVLADDPMLTVRGVRAPRVAPMRVVFDRHARLPLDSALVRSAPVAPVLAVVESPDDARARALEASGVTLLPAFGPGAALEELARRGIRSLLVEGGARLAGALLAEALVDRLIIFQGAVLLGAGALGAFSAVPPAAVGAAPRFRAIRHRTLGDDGMTVYAPVPPAGRPEQPAAGNDPT